MFEIVVKGISELVAFVSSVLYPTPRGFRPVLTFALKTNISCFQLICSVRNHSVGYENRERLVKLLLLLLSESRQNPFPNLYLRTLFPIVSYKL